MPLGRFPPAPVGSAGPAAAMPEGVPRGGGGLLCRWARAGGQQPGPAALVPVLEGRASPLRDRGVAAAGSWWWPVSSTRGWRCWLCTGQVGQAAAMAVGGCQRGGTGQQDRAGEVRRHRSAAGRRGGRQGQAKAAGCKWPSAASALAAVALLLGLEGAGADRQAPDRSRAQGAGGVMRSGLDGGADGTGSLGCRWHWPGASETVRLRAIPQPRPTTQHRRPITPSASFCFGTGGVVVWVGWASAAPTA